MCYIIISPVRNEKGNIEKTIASVVNQTVLPQEWILINDNSDDGTELILEDTTDKYKWIKVIKPDCFEISDYSSRLVHLFYFGLHQIDQLPEYIVKLDGDLSFKSSFFENLLAQFKNNQNLGIASGHLTINGVPEKIFKTPYISTRGAAKVYRTTCLEDIGGIISFQGWDTLDNVAARAKGWEVAILPEYFEHLKEEGSKVGNKAYNHFRTGYYNGVIPYLWIYFLPKAMSKLFQKPIILSSILQIAGFIKGKYFSKIKPYPKYIVDALHKEQICTLKSFFKNS
jgi:poly-beta-1,6-N-acetyl-D-glucosamine synthase